MWVRDLRAVAFSDWATLRRPVPEEALATAVHAALAERGVSIPLREFLESWRRAGEARTDARWSDLSERPMEALLAERSPYPPDRLADVLVRGVESVASTTEWFPDALPTLDYLRESGFRLAVISDSPVPLGPSWERRFAPWVDVVVLSRDVGKAKPHSDMFRAALDRIGATPRQVLHVGDHVVVDVFGAKSLGMRTALLERTLRAPPDARSLEWLRREHDLRAEDVVPDLKIRTLEEVPALIESFG